MRRMPAREVERGIATMTEPSTSGKRVLFMAEGVTLAHVGRCLRLADTAHRSGFEVTLACDPRYERFLTGLPFRTLPLQSMSSEQFLATLARGRPVFSRSTLRRYVEADQRLIGDAGPDAIVGDFRLSLSVSARLARVPYANVTNAYWSPYARPDFRMPALPLSRYIPPGMGDRIFRIARPLAFALHAAPMNRTRRRYGMPPLGADVRKAYCDGDLTLYADLPALIPIYDAPSTHRHIGPVLWSPIVSAPDWWSEVLAGPKPIYVSLGSSGPVDLLPQVIEALRPLGRTIVVATAGRRCDVAAAPGLRIADFLPGDVIAAKACVVVCNGGSPTSMQALANGVPVIGVASNLDQILNMGYIEQFGAGVLVRGDRLQTSVVRRAVERMLDEAHYRQRAETLQGMFGSVEPLFNDALRTLIAMRLPKGAAPASDSRIS